MCCLCKWSAIRYYNLLGKGIHWSFQEISTLLILTHEVSRSTISMLLRTRKMDSSCWGCWCFFSSKKRNNTSKCRVCILTAGRGSRMGGLCDILNKALLPLSDGRAVISHIVDKFRGQDATFVIGLGYLGHQVEEYMRKHHADLSLVFCPVDNFLGWRAIHDPQKGGPRSTEGEKLIGWKSTI